VYLFRVDGRYREYREAGHVDLSDRLVCDATSVSVVQTRPWSVAADVVIPSVSPSDDFTVRTRFRCRVTRAEQVAEAGYTDLSAILANHLRQDRDLSSLGARHRIDDVNVVRPRVDAQISAYCMLSPVAIRGLDIEFESVQVLTPKDLREQARRVRDEEWDQDVRRQQRRFEDEDIERLAARLSRGAVHADAVGVSRGEINLSDVSARAHEVELERRKQIASVVQDLANRGFFDRVALDPVALMNAVTGGVGAGDPLADLPVADRPALARAEGSDDLDEPDFIPNEEDDD
jgi:hypothetical protein